MGFKEISTWVFVFTVTGYENEVFPYTSLGKIVATSIRVVIISSVMFIVGRVSADYIKTLIKGNKMQKGYNLKDHIVICDWNQKGEQIVEELHSPLLQEHGMARPIIIITPSEFEFPDTPAFEDTFCIPGDPISPWKLRNASIHQAFAVIILAETSMERSEVDTHTVLVAMEIAELFDEMEAQGLMTKRPHISAEILDGKNIKYLKRAGVNEVISGGDLGVKLLAQSAVTPGITAFMDDLLHYSDKSNEVYIIDPPEKLVKKKASFRQIVDYLMANRTECEGALLVGIQRGADSPKMMVNPTEQEFSGLEANDRLVLIARKRPNF